MKKGIILGIVSLLLLSGCGKVNTSASKEAAKHSHDLEPTSVSKKKDITVYPIDITSISTDKNMSDDWNVKGTTKAPDGSKIIVMTDGFNSSEAKNSVKWPSVKNGKVDFDISLGLVTGFNDDGENSAKIFAVQNYNHKYSDGNVSGLKNKTKSIKSTKLALDQTQKDSMSSANSVASSSSSSTDQGQAYADKLASVDKGTATDVTYDASTNTVTWTGYDDWANWSDGELQKSMNILQTRSLKYEAKYGIQNVKIVVQLPDGTVIAKNSDSDSELHFVN
ncbi:hypothetical protein IV38_GL001936 [Lactobacillus selangorensis]|uniref:Lipoprotein n=1 Tax=Lactobacillus selangorensis TaxID=81857 RepID=A0A0R2FPC9_9LACO|nr:hypothetical protein [Lactobacillus selangorensis]KRN27723.1 hypothetical protein IV38_GL001936 [Lactobacillus selangorensis]KRN30312.1 hypothetical protein IV40_GL001901 [Lactobacillus selangorensis]